MWMVLLKRTLFNPPFEMPRKKIGCCVENSMILNRLSGILTWKKIVMRSLNWWNNKFSAESIFTHEFQQKDISVVLTSLLHKKIYFNNILSSFECAYGWKYFQLSAMLHRWIKMENSHGLFSKKKFHIKHFL